MKRALIAALAVVAVAAVAAATLKPAHRPHAMGAPKPPPPRSSLEQLRAEPLEPRFEALKPLHAAAPPVKKGDWLATYPEPGESFAAYVDGGPVRATPERRRIYLVPIGTFSAAQLHVLAQTADYVERFFQLPVVTLPALPAETVPAKARRRGQLLTTYILFDVLVPMRPDDAVAVMALTADDLYPAPDWNFVFGEASTVERVGVWSLFRNGEPGTELYLLRTLKTATHELGHMLSMQHCVAWSCLMAGSNSLEESDVQPASVCPVCLQKLAWNVGLDPVKRGEELVEFFVDAGVAADEVELLRNELKTPP